MTSAHSVITRCAAVALVLAASAHAGLAQGGGLDGRAVALTWHKVSREPLDFRAAAERSDAVTHASNFDRPDATKAEAARLEHDLAAMDASREFVVRVSDNISEYDHDRGEFSVMLFKPGFFVDVPAFAQQYRLVFANAEQARAIKMAKDEARVFDAKLNATGRAVVDEIHFRVTGTGDPSGAVTGQQVIRAEITSAQMLDRAGAVVFAPKMLVSAASPTTQPNPSSTSGTSKSPGPSASSAALDVAGLRVGMKAKDLERTLRRLFGPTTREASSKSWFPGFRSALVVNDMKCVELPGRGRAPAPGTVCVTAFLDGDDIVRSIRVERVFPYVDAEVFRATLVRRYGPVTDAKESGTYALGWGPPIDKLLAYDQSGPHTAVAAYYEANDDFMTRGMNALPHIRVVLQLVDASWASQPGK